MPDVMVLPVTKNLYEPMLVCELGAVIWMPLLLSANAPAPAVRLPSVAISTWGVPDPAP